MLELELMLSEVARRLGRLRVTIAFADLAGYTRLTEDAGEVKLKGFKDSTELFLARPAEG